MGENLNFFAFSACKSKNFLYFCNQVLADRRDTTLLRQADLSPGAGAGMTLVVNSKSIRYYFALSQEPRKLIIGIITSTIIICEGVSTALLSALLAMEGKCVSPSEGIVDDNVDKSIHNLTSIGADAMIKTDDMVLNIMTSKSCD